MQKVCKDVENVEGVSAQVLGTFLVALSHLLLPRKEVLMGFEVSQPMNMAKYSKLTSSKNTPT